VAAGTLARRHDSSLLLRWLPGSRPGGAAAARVNGAMKTHDTLVGWVAVATLLVAWSLETLWQLPG